MKLGLLDYLACPDCESDFSCKTSKEDNGEVVEGTLLCNKCGNEFPIKKGIPRILPPDLSHIEEKTSQGFGYQWKSFRSFLDESEKQFFKWLYPLSEDYFKNKVVLDAGCGSGRHSYYVAKHNAKTIIGVDISDAVEVAHEIVKDFKNAHIIQASIYRLPLKKDKFDFVFSIGVLHHLPEPQEGFRRLVRHARNGGYVFAWVYGRENNRFVTDFVEPIRAHITTKISVRPLKYISLIPSIILFFIIMGIYRPLNVFGFTRKFAEKLPYNEYFLQFSKLSFKHNWVNVYDKLVAPLANYYTKEEFEKWLKDSNLKDIELNMVNRISWSGRGIKRI